MWATLFKFHKALVVRKCRLLFSSRDRRREPGPKGPSAELIAAIVELKRRNPRVGCVRIAQRIFQTFGVDIDEDVARRVLVRHYRPGGSGSDGPSWLIFIVQAKGSLWSLDLFRREPILLRTHWVVRVMNVFTRHTIGFAVEPAPVDGVSVRQMFSRTIAGRRLSKRVRTDRGPLFRFHRGLADMRILEIAEIESAPYTPDSHPMVERLIGTIRRKYLDRVFFWNATDQRCKLDESSRITEMPLGCIAASPATPRRIGPAYAPLLPSRCFNAVGSSIAGACCRSRSPLDYEFATHRLLFIVADSLLSMDRGNRDCENAVAVKTSPSAGDRVSAPPRTS